ncbi:MAG: VCBS repeat-containing protein [candidate division Zixibacteria bacterium]|nr:VCBS repeat-containing protein [candidate division Zixibacteria bacterium]
MKHLRLTFSYIWVLLTPALLLSEPLFDHKTEYPVGSAPIDIIAADFTGDGYADLALTNFTYGSSIDLSILINQGDGTFTDYTYYSTGRNYLRAMTAADLDNDGDIDLALARAGGTYNVITMLNDGNGTFQLSQTYDAGDNALSICAYRLNTDNWIDLAVAYEESNDVAVLFNNGDGTYTDTPHFACGPWATSITGGDFNKDGAVDLVVTNAVSAFDPGRVSVYLNTGNGTFWDSVNYPAGNQPYSVIAGDFDDDDNLDLAVADGDYDGYVLVLFGSDNAVFQDPVSYDIGHNALDVIAADLDNNGSLDLVAGTGSDSSIVIF